MNVCENVSCSKPFPTTTLWRRFCSRRCQRNTMRGRRRALLRAKKPEKMPQKPPKPKSKRLYCSSCGGKHLRADCTNRSADMHNCRQFGTVVNGEYVPYPGTSVRVISIPNTVNGDTLSTMLRDLGGEE